MITLAIANKLSLASEKAFRNPYQEIDWHHKVDSKSRCFSESLSSLYQTDWLTSLSEQEKNHFYFFECINFFSINIMG